MLGVNSKELVFGHRFQDSVLYIKKELSDVHCIDVYEYNENDFLRLLHEHYEFQEDKVKYTTINMAGISTTKQIPKLIKMRMLCRIGIENDSVLYFCYKNTPETAEVIKKIQKHTCSNV